MRHHRGLECLGEPLLFISSELLRVFHSLIQPHLFEEMTAVLCVHIWAADQNSGELPKSRLLWMSRTCIWSPECVKTHPSWTFLPLGSDLHLQLSGSISSGSLKFREERCTIHLCVQQFQMSINVHLCASDERHVGIWMPSWAAFGVKQ